MPAQEIDMHRAGMFDFIEILIIGKELVNSFLDLLYSNILRGEVCDRMRW